jgi:hypothetical protein
MKGAQFVRGMINGNSYTYESANLAEVLPKEYYNLMDLRTIGVTLMHDANLRFFAQVVISQTEPDAMNRQGYIKHCVCFRADPYTKHDETLYFYNAAQFEQAYTEGVFNFEMPPLPELNNPLPQPVWRTQP